MFLNCKYVVFQMDEIGYLIQIKRIRMKRIRTFDRHAKEITRQAEQMWSSAYYFPPGRNYYPSDLPLELAKKYNIHVSAHEKALDLVRLALKHGALAEDIRCWAIEGKLKH